MQNRFARIVLNVPIRRYFDYIIPDAFVHSLAVGMRVRVPFGRNDKMGMVLGLSSTTEWQESKLKTISAVLDDEPLFDAVSIHMCEWLCRYYLCPPGEAFINLLPKKLKAGELAVIPTEPLWFICDNTTAKIAEKAKKQLDLYALLRLNPLTTKAILAAGFTRGVLNSLRDNLVIEQREVDAPLINKQVNCTDSPHELLTEQQAAVDAIIAANGSFSPILLQGVTGSGKTEVYIQAMAEVLQQQKQVLVLVPEIGLTPQTLQRFIERFDCEIAVLHSELNDTERHLAWLKAKTGQARIVIGTRSAVLVPLTDLGLIILDEEHDLSFKQQDSLRYNARDVAVKRAHLQAVPIVLGTATPSLETYHNARSGKYQHLYLKQRVKLAKPPTPIVLDIKDQPMQVGLAPRVVDLIAQHLNLGNQVLIFLNRRGYAPALMCHECGWIYHCQRCETHFTYHRSTGLAQCHHCGDAVAVPRQCFYCGSTQIIDWGVGTEKLEEWLGERFPDTPPLRVDRDNIRRKGELEQKLKEVKEGKHQLLIGTQMLAKGHHFPDLTLTVVVNLDSALFSADFRALERMSQLLIQVAGRAGRGEKKGQVVLQSHHPTHEIISLLTTRDYDAVLQYLLHERQAMLLPPFQHWVVLRIDAHQSGLVVEFCRQVAELIRPYLASHYTDVQMIPAFPAAQEKRAGKYRYLMVFESKQRNQLNAMMLQLCQLIEKQKGMSQVRWIIDVDPQEVT
ncbi:primosomal protein N' [Algibacillus agarilyticus]|uniref:primosomal protein N' n=1 Tax=Algibacillus agarilyticus TaxID=2234133 RepID=UPI000DD006D6|nr:primosomal protein N' [Algibacillus agarilyticus]